MNAYVLVDEAEFDPSSHVEKILGRFSGGDVTVACWEPGQRSPDHSHPEAVEIYFCFQGGGTMYADEGETEVRPGAFVVHDRGEFKQFVNGDERTLLFRVRYGEDMRMVER